MWNSRIISLWPNSLTGVIFCGATHPSFAHLPRHDTRNIKNRGVMCTSGEALNYSWLWVNICCTNCSLSIRGVRYLRVLKELSENMSVIGPVTKKQMGEACGVAARWQMNRDRLLFWRLRWPICYYTRWRTIVTLCSFFRSWIFICCFSWAIFITKQPCNLSNEQKPNTILKVKCFRHCVQIVPIMEFAYENFH